MTIKSTVVGNGDDEEGDSSVPWDEIAKDLREADKKESATAKYEKNGGVGGDGGGIEWNWGDDNNDNHNDDDENDSDATSVILSSEDEAEMDSSKDINTSKREKEDRNDDGTTSTALSFNASSPPAHSKTNAIDKDVAVEKNNISSREDEDDLAGKDKADYSSKNNDNGFLFSNDVDGDDDDADDELSVVGGDGDDGPTHHPEDQPLLDEGEDDEPMLKTKSSMVKRHVAASGNDDDDDEVAMEDDDDDDSLFSNASSGKKRDKKIKAKVIKKGKKCTDKSAGGVVKQKKGKKKKQKSKQPDLDDLLRSTDVLFELADDKNAVKVSEINESLEDEYECQLSKANKKAVRAHLTYLINEQVNNDSESERSEDDHDDDFSDSDNDEKPKSTKRGHRYTKLAKKNQKPSKDTSDDDLEDPENESAASEPANESESEASNDESKPKTTARKGRNQKKRSPPKPRGSKKTENLQESDDESSFGKPDESEVSDFEEGAKLKKRRGGGKKQKKKEVGNKKKKITKPKPLGKRKAAKAARLIEAERLRKKRMEELRIRNEEMQLNISNEERERSEKLAARFDTDTSELRAKRLEDRLNLLQALDKKRFEVVEIKDEDDEPEQAVTPKLEDEKKKGESSDSEEESSDDEDLEIVGAAKPLKPMKPIHTHFQSKALDILKKLRSPDGQKTKARTKAIISPGTSNLNARNALRSKLKERQRTAGNRWLARELGYNTEQEHLKDCQSAMNQKRQQVIKFEQMRLKANERKQLRERMLLADEEAPANEDEGEEEFKPGDTPDAEEEENEELQLARQIEQENNKDDIGATPASGMPSVNDGTMQGSPDDADAADTEQIEETAHESQDIIDESQRLETQPPLDATALRDTLVSKVSAEEFDTGDAEGNEKSMDEDEFDESQRLETQPPPDIPVMDSFAKMTPRIVSEESEDTTTESNQVNDDISLGGTSRVEKSAKTTASASQLETDDGDESEEELEFVDSAPVALAGDEATAQAAKKSNKPRNAGWQAMLKREAEKLKKQKKRKNGDLFEEEAEEEEEEEVAGLEDFGFSVKKKDKDGDDEEDKANDDDLDEEDLKHIVDELSDDEGDEEAGRKARKRLQEREEKERHKDMLRRMREGYDGRRGGIAGGAGARGLHRFDQLVAADNREDAKRLGLLNDDEMDSDEDDEKKKSGDNDDEEDEAALVDKMLKDRFLHRSSENADLEEHFSEDEEEENPAADNDTGNLSEEEEERTQERLAKRFAKRARMQRLEEMYSESQEFSQQRMIDEDESMKIELQSMKNGLLRKRSVSSSRSSFSEQHGSNLPLMKRQRSSSVSNSITTSFGGSFMDKNGSLSIALKASRKTKQRTSFLGGAKVGDSNKKGASSGFVHRSVSLSRVVFHQTSSRSSISNSNLAGKGGNMGTGKRKERPGTAPTSLFSKVAGRG